ncbi:inorganic pyrophosphatase [Dactylonectria macrodidyma]|uniref:inorganic diphosphatase n=1 Tax=Dactylonectria macrodidyma TaxID=307937 RepID=A0A9P9EY41_9HYPO|nr:inorganic pyrophosphatase [Dactylonectria macrodidyma]
MVAGSALLKLALLPALALSSAIVARDEESDFDYDSLDLREVGARNTLNWRIWLERDGKPVSFWHDIPLYPNRKDTRIVNFVVEIPRWTDGKIEISRNEPLNPILHASREGLPRFVESVWPHKSYPFHYGIIPQTWESPNFKHEFTKHPGGNGPIDLLDISETTAHTGQVKKVKILGGLALKDGRVANWKVIGIDVNDPLAGLVNHVFDLERYRPGLSDAFFHWLRYHEVPRGDFTLDVIDGKWQKEKFMAKTVKKSHDYWRELLRGQVNHHGVNYNHTNNPDLKESYVDSKDATEHFNIPKKSKVLFSAERPAIYDTWHYLDQNHDPIILSKKTSRS